MARRMYTRLAVSPGVRLLAAAALSSLAMVSANGTGTGTGSSTLDREELSSIEKGMAPLYSMTNRFLTVVHDQNPYDFYDFSSILEGQGLKIYKDKEKVKPNLPNQWKLFVNHYKGYAVCICIGLLFILVMQFFNCCFCCCRLCGKCGGRPREMDPKNAACKRNTHSFILGTFTCFLLAGVVCVLVTNNLVNKTLTGNKDIGNALKRSVMGIQGYFVNTKKSLHDDVLTSFDVKSKGFMKSLRNIPMIVIENLTNVTSSLDHLDKLSQETKKTKKSLEDMQNSLKNLKNLGNELNTKLSNITNNVFKKLNLCPNSTCTSLIKMINGTHTDANFSSLDEQIDKLQEVEAAVNISSFINKSREELTKMKDNLAKPLENGINSTEKKFQQIEEKIGTKLNEIDLKKIFNPDMFDNFAESYKKLSGTYLKIPWYIGIAIGTILALIVVLFCFGLLFGMCGERSGKEAECCNRGIAANFLMSGVGFYLIFCSLLMLVLLLYFTIGGLMYTESCKYLVRRKPLDLQKFVKGYNVPVTFLENSLHFQPFEIWDNCRKNESIVRALNFTFNLSAVVDFSKVEEVVKGIKNESFNVSSITLLGSDLKTKLNNIQNSNISSINFTQYEEQLKKKLTTTDLTVLASKLKNPALKQFNVTGYADDLLSLNKGVIANMTQESENLKEALGILKKNVHLQNTATGLIDKLKEAQATLNHNMSEKIQEIISSEVKKIQDIINTIVEKISNIGKCKPVSDALFFLTDFICVSFLNPFNAFWFSLGWSLFFGILSSIFAVKLVGLFRSKEKYRPSSQHSDQFGDNIPLASRAAPLNQTPYGHPNSAYYPEDHSRKESYESLQNYRPDTKPHGGYAVYPSSPGNFKQSMNYY